MNRSKPIVGVDITEVQWDNCDLSNCPPERVVDRHLENHQSQSSKACSI